jgi:Ala-tRNA(Pro) deacylase
MTMYERLETFLTAHQAKYEVMRHPAAVTAQEQAAAMHMPGMHVAKVLIVKERDGFVMAVVPAATRLDLDRLKGLIGHDDVRLATADELRIVVPDCAPGAIPPFGAPYGLRTFVDQRLMAVPDVTVPAGDPHVSLRLRCAEFRRLVGGQEGDFAVPEALVTSGGVMRSRLRRRRALGGPRRRRAARGA